MAMSDPLVKSISEIKDMLAAQKSILETRLAKIKSDIRHDEVPLEQDFEEQAVQRENDEVLDHLGQSAQTELAEINKAFQRMEAGSYGTCVSCERDIGVARLFAVPYTELCSRCAQSDEEAEA